MSRSAGGSSRADFARFKPNYSDKHGVRGRVVFEKWRQW